MRQNEDEEFQQIKFHPILVLAHVSKNGIYIKVYRKNMNGLKLNSSIAKTGRWNFIRACCICRRILRQTCKRVED